MLIPVVDHMFSRLPFFTVIHIFHGPSSRMELKKKYNSINSRVVLHNLGSDSMQIYEYNELILDAGFWKKFEGEWVLVFQTDSVLCNTTPYTWKDFISSRWDYVGAVSPTDQHENGGFSLRRRSAIINTLGNLTKFQICDCNEDMVFSVLAHDLSYLRRAPREVAMHFSVQNSYSFAPFAVHNPWKYLKGQEMIALVKTCPEITTVLRRQIR